MRGSPQETTGVVVAFRNVMHFALCLISLALRLKIVACEKPTARAASPGMATLLLDDVHHPGL